MCLREDLKKIKIHNKKECDQVIKQNYSLIKQLYEYVLSQSPTYPNLPSSLVYDLVINKINIYKMLSADFDKILQSSHVARSAFVGMFYNLAQSMVYRNLKPYEVLGVIMSEVEAIPVSSWKRERDEIQKNTDAELVNNESGLRELFFKMAVRQEVSLESIVQMCSVLVVTRKQVVYAFVASKMTQIFDATATLVWVEFLEFICRVTMHEFLGTEMESLQLARKLPHTLRKLLGHNY